MVWGRIRRKTTAAAVLSTSAAIVAAGSWAPGATGAGSIYVEDMFERATSTGWGSADVGGSWESPSPSLLSVSGGVGRMLLSPGHTAVAHIDHSGSSDVDITVDVSADRAPTGGGQYSSIIARGTERTGYRLLAKRRPNGDVDLAHLRYVDGGRTVLARARVDGLMAAGGQMRMRLQIEGSAPTTLRGKVWRVGQQEPGDWVVTATDAGAALPASSSVGLLSYLSASSEDAAVRIGYDNFSASTVGTSTEAPGGSAEPTGGRPDSSTTGVPTGVSLRTLTRSTIPYSADRMYSDGSTLIINTPNAVYDGWRFDMFVEVRAPGVRFTRSEFRGHDQAKWSRGLLAIYNSGSKGRPSALVEDSTLIPRSPSRFIDGVRGSNVTLRRVEIARTVDGVRIFGTTSYSDPGAGNVRIEDSWIHDLRYFQDASHPDGTHNDGVQVMGGRNIAITGSRIDGTIRNAGVMITHGRNDVSDVTIRGNWAAGGGCTVNVFDGDGPGAIEGLTMSDNVFTRGTTRITDCAMIVSDATRGLARASNNTWHDSSTPAPTMMNGR